MRLIDVAVIFSLALAPLAAAAQQAPGKVYRIKVILAANPTTDAEGPNPREQNVAALLRGRRDLGYVCSHGDRGQASVEQPTKFELVINMRRRRSG